MKSEYYKRTYNMKENTLLKEFIQFFSNKNSDLNAIDLGCGVGRDTLFLINNGYKVLSIDKTPICENLIKSKLTKNQYKNFRFMQSDFESIHLPKTNLIVAMNSISFCSKEKIAAFWNNIDKSLNKNRIFGL